MKTLLAKLLGVSSKVLEWFLPVLKIAVSSGLAALLPAALEIVRSLDGQDLTGKQKLNNAVNRLKEEAVKQGIEASASMLNYAVESAVQRLRAEGGQ